MHKYVLLAQAADAASANILVKGADGLRAQQEALVPLGGRREAQLVATGDYGIVLIEHLPTDSSVLALSLAGNTGLYVAARRANGAAEPDAAAGGYVIKNVWHNMTHPAPGPTYQFPQYALRVRLKRPSPPPLPRPR
jgi:uncharacterized protein with GYD domain